MDKRPALRLAAALLAALGVGCASPGGGPAPVIDRSTHAARVPAEHTVKAGDSLYAIAWRHQLDYKAIARLNGIGPPYTIYPGQTLELPSGAPVRAGSRPAPVTRGAAPQADAVTPGAGGQDAAPPRQAAPKPRASDRTAARVPAPRAQPPSPAPPTPAAKPAASQRTPAAQPTRPAPPPAPAAPTAAAPKPAASGGRWRWPVDGRPERGFGGGNNGFDYTVARGKGVGAAAPGVVVYSGPGLRGYKHLVIVEHGGGYLSAYSINAPPQVAEGGAVTAGARLAEMGGANAVARRLHFEIRRNGAPVDPRKVIGR